MRCDRWGTRPLPLPEPVANPSYATVRNAHGGSGMNAPVYIEIGNEPGDVPITPPQHRDAARTALELLLGG